MKPNGLNRKLYSALLILAIFISSFSSMGSRDAFAQYIPPEIRPGRMMPAHKTGIHKTVGAESASLAPVTLMPAASPLPTTVVHITDTSNGAGGWNPSSPDPSGIDYWPLTGRLLISDSEVDEIPAYWVMKNVYDATTSGTLVSTCRTTFSVEPSGVAINPNNNHIFFSDDNGMTADRVFEVSLGPDGTYCTGDDTVVSTSVSTLYGIVPEPDAEDVAYGNNTLFIADGVNAEVYAVPLGANGVLGGGDDGSVTHFDTAHLNFNNVEGIGYNGDSGTLFILSALPNERFLGEITTAGTLLKTYDLASAGLIHPEDVTYAPGSLNPAIKNIYLTDRGLDNNVDPNENDGRIFEINLGIPRVASILRANANPTNASSVNFTVTFSEAVTGVDVTDFSLNAPGVSGAAVSQVSGSGITRTVTVNTGAGNGTLRLDVTDNNSIRDADNIELGGSGMGDGNFITGEVYTISRVPGAASLVSPSGSIGTTYNPTYTWDKVSGATWYYLWVQRPSGNPIKIWYDASIVCGASTCSATPATTLGGGAHTWWIQTWNEVGYGPWSAGMSFSTTIPTPPSATTLISPSGSTTDTTPDYTWNKVTGVTWYYLWVQRPSGDPIKIWYDANIVCGASTCTATPATTLGSGNHTWWVQTWNSAGFGPWSTGMNFSPTAPGAATLVSPTGSTSDTTPTYIWNKVTGADWYYLWVNGPSGNGITQIWYDASVACGATTCSVTPPTTLTSGSYNWWVQTWNSAGYGLWSNAMNFSLP